MSTVMTSTARGGVARVNLLPPEIGQRRRERRNAGIAAGLLLLFVALLGLLYVAKLAQVERARGDRDQALAEVRVLETRVAALQPYAELDAKLTARNELLRLSMRTEVSWARALNDLSLSFPDTASLLTLSGTTGDVDAETATAAAPPPATPPATPEGTDGTVAEDGTAVPAAEPEPEPLVDPAAMLNLTGYSTEEYAPGIRSVLRQTRDARGYKHAFLQTADREERGTTEVVNFSATVKLERKTYTGRYADGLPAEVER